MTAAATALTIREKLQSVAGVTISNDWLTACLSHLANSSEDSADEVLHEILHSDLRDVVRSCNDDIVPTDANPGLMRRAIEESSLSSLRKITLPPHFRLLVQIEELLDVSVNAETRLSSGPASPNSPSAVGNQAKRTLKIYLSDGHSPQLHMVAMEVDPIPNLSVNSNAGLKMVLHGCIDLRFGVIMLNAASTHILGGVVQAMVEQQVKAREQAQRMAGIGIDPTVKALIWNPDTGLDDEDGADEGETEGESGDIASLRVTPTGKRFVRTSETTVPLPASQQVMPSPIPVPLTTIATLSTASANLHGPPYQTPQHILEKEPQNTFGQPGATLANIYMQMPQPIAIATSTTHTEACLLLDPPLPFTTASSSALIRVCNPPIADANTTYSNPYAPRKLNTVPTDSVIYNRINNTQCSPEDNMMDLTQPEVSGSFLPVARVSSRRSMSFHDICLLLEQARTDRTLYETQHSTIFVVEGKMKGDPKYFNIEKNRARTGTDEKYMYVMVIDFTGSAENDAVITTTVSPTICQPFFSVGPTVMRNLSKIDKADADVKVRASGFAVQKALMALAYWELKFKMTAEDYMKKAPTLDGKDAVLELLRKCD